MTEIERCRPWIKAALERSSGTHTAADVIDGIKAGEFQLWPAERGCLVTEIFEFPQRRVLNVFLGAGDMDQLVDMHDSVVAFARQNGCAAVRVTGRAGWARVWRKAGFKPLFQTIEKEL